MIDVQLTLKSHLCGKRRGFPGGLVVKNLPTMQENFPVAHTGRKLLAMQETQVPSLGGEDPLEKGMATHSSILAWRIPRTEEPSGL